jgi:DNA-binding PadR family transcriptional regulator
MAIKLEGSSSTSSASLKPAPKPKRALPAGWAWQPVTRAVKAGGKTVNLVVSWKKVRISGTSTTSGGSSSGGGGGSYSGGGSADKGLSAYIQQYRIMFGRNVSPPDDLLKQAEANNWSMAYWEMQVRLKDKKYYTSDEARKRLIDFKSTMQSLFPGIAKKSHPMNQSTFYHNMALKYLKEGWNADQLLVNIAKSRAWRKANPDYKAYLAGQAKLGTMAEANPLMFKQYVVSLQNAMAEYGMEMPEDWYKTYFRSRYASKEGFGDFTTNLKNLAQGMTSFALFEGRPVTKQEQEQVLFGGKEQSNLRQKIARAFAVQSSMTAGQPLSSPVSMDQNRLTQPLI